ncbi:MAG: response regulator [Myxococcaceae bacterium]
MSLPLLLLVDDSEAILAFESAALAGRYALSTATTGQEALEKIQSQRPSLVLLDLSMPGLSGDEVLARLRADPSHRELPVVIVSSERARAEACLTAGANAFLPKPLRADELVATAARVLAEAHQRARSGGLAVLFLEAGALELAIPLSCVRGVVHQPATRPLPGGPSYLCEFFDYHGGPMCILGLARRLGVEPRARLADRKLVLIDLQGAGLALCVDEVREPQEFLAAELVQPARLGTSGVANLGELLIAMVPGAHGQVPVLDPRALVSRALLDLPAAKGASPG